MSASLAPTPISARVSAGPTAGALRELARPRSAADRLRARTTAAASAGIGVALLLATSVAGLRAPDSWETRGVVDEDGGYRVLGPTAGLAPYLQQSGLRPGVVLALVLLVVPLLALAFQALRVGSLALERQAELLALAGATPSDLRALRVRRTVRAFAVGGVVAGPLYVVVWLGLGVAVPYGRRLVPTPEGWMPLAWVGVVAVLVVLGALLGAVASPGRRAQPLASRTRREPPPAWLGWTAAAAGVALVFSAGTVASHTTFPVLVLAIVLLFLAAAWVAASRTAARSGRRRRRVRGRDAAVAVLAAAQRRGDARAAGTVAAVMFVCGLSFGFEVAFSAGVLGERSLAEDASFYVGGAVLAGLVGVVGVLVALTSLGLALTDHLLGARRSVASTAALGTELRRLLAVQARVMRSASVPAVAIGALVSGIPYALVVVGADGGDAGGVLRALAAVAAVAVVAALLTALACSLVAALLAGRVRAAAALEHLRVP